MSNPLCTVILGDARYSEGSLFRKRKRVRYSEGSLFRNTQIAYTKMFVNPKTKQGSLIRTFVALFRRFVIPNVCSETLELLIRMFVSPNMKKGSLMGKFVTLFQKFINPE